ncbi:cytochrome P450 [Saccharopolyspora gloriosae]|uniref:cytochrome P450 n=1 Tax=Saccharopolyspora gloriosae TaxID=455344 RepID=UPI001FB6B9FA|nr:cytochrome P450 [Saccharopolyspora gloriosae]
MTALSPGHLDQHGRVPLYGEEFTANPEDVYSQLRARGPIVPVLLAPDVPAMLVVDYDTALQVLRSPHVFVKDSRRWQDIAPPDSPVLPMMSWRPNTLFADGERHARLRPPVENSLAAVKPAQLRRFVQSSAINLIQGFTGRGHADLLGEYAAQLPLLVLQQMFGCPAEIAQDMVAAIAALWDGTDPQLANQYLETSVADLVRYKRATPGDDVTTRMIEHPHGLDDDELVHQLIVTMGAGAEPLGNWIANALYLLLTEHRVADAVATGSVALDEALDDVLWRFTPLTNYAITYPRHALHLGQVALPADEPVVISMAAINTDPALHPNGPVPAGNRAHLAFSAGAHTCPASRPARLIATVALETLLDYVPEVELDDQQPLQWRPGPFHRALTALPVRFPAVTTLAEPATGGSECPHHSAP